jgi:benzoyl-CoA reductase subunit D
MGDDMTDQADADMLTTAGVDVGSSSIKVAIVRSAGARNHVVVAKIWQRIRRRNVHEVTRTAMDDCCTAAGVALDDLDYVASTGDGDAVPFRTGHFYSMSTHARGALALDPEARAVLDVGALHARAIRMDERGKVLAHRMTSQCASGTGQFLENIGRYLGVPLEDIGALSCSASRAEPVSSICAVLAETDVINMVSRGTPTAEILRGIHESIAGRLVRLVRATAAQGVVLVTGGLSQDAGLLEAIDAAPLVVRSHPDAIYAGALGAALLAARRHGQLLTLGRLPHAAQSLGSSGNTSAVTASGAN